MFSSVFPLDGKEVIHDGCQEIKIQQEYQKISEKEYQEIWTSLRLLRRGGGWSAATCIATATPRFVLGMVGCETESECGSWCLSFAGTRRKRRVFHARIPVFSFDQPVHCATTPRSIGLAAPVTCGRLAGTPSSVAAPSSAKAMASLALLAILT